MPDGDVKEAKEILETRSATRGVFDKFPDIAKQALQRSWNDAQKLLDNAKDYFSEENTIALLAQITYENDGATISISVRNDAKDNLSMRLKEVFDSFAKTLLKDSTIKAKSEYIPGEYATIHHTDKCTISAITYKLSTHFRDFKDSSNIELIVLKDNTVYACAPMHKTIEMKTTNDEYKDCLGLKDLVSVVAKKKALSR